MRYDAEGFYSGEEREQTIEYIKGGKAWNEIPFNLLPEPVQAKILSKMNAFFPTTCPVCGHTDEAAFLTGVGIKHCQRCHATAGCVPISNLPDVEIVKARIWDMASENIVTINEIKAAMKFEPTYNNYWSLYLDFRSKKTDK